MNDLASIRAEIKAWEHTFRSQEDRDPSVDDIKKLPDIAQKYKTYKKLSKAAVTAAPTFPQSPSTPTRPSRLRNGSPPILAGLGSRVVAPAAPLATFNPFSPQKVKGKEREKSAPRFTQPVFNPFASPAQIRPAERSASPPAPSSAVTRARKRLRGELVSPSPSKEKRRRTGSQTTLNFNRKFSCSFKTDHDKDEDEHETSFVDDSPVKSLTGRAFSLLFDESRPPPNADIFGLKVSSSSVTQDITQPNLKPVNRKIFSPSSHTRTSETNLEPSNLKVMHLDGEAGHRTATANKDESDDISDQRPTRRSKSPLLPPSPPPASAQLKGPAKGKRKADNKAYTNRKKLKLSNSGTDEEDSNSDSSEFQTRIKIVDRPHVKKASAHDDMDPEFDPVLNLPHALHDAVPKAAVHINSPIVDLNLPDRFKRVLDLKPTQWRGQDVEEDKLVKSLLYRRRTTTYDSKKGEIWDVGEDDMVNDEERDEVDEWEGEPVPWEVAEF